MNEFVITKNAQKAFNFCHRIIQYRQWGMIYGEPGIGKTRIKTELFKQLDRKKVVMIRLNTFSSTQMSIGGILSAMLNELEAGCKIPRDIDVRAKALRNVLVRVLERKQNVVLVIEEVQNLHPSVIRDLKIIHEIEAGGYENLFAILFFAKPSIRFDSLLSGREIGRRVAVRNMTLPNDEEVIKIAESYGLQFASQEIRQEFVLATDSFPVSIKFIAQTMQRIDGFNGEVSLEFLKMATVENFKRELREYGITNRDLQKKVEEETGKKVSLGLLNEALNGKRTGDVADSVRDVAKKYLNEKKEKVA